MFIIQVPKANFLDKMVSSKYFGMGDWNITLSSQEKRKFLPIVKFIYIQIDLNRLIFIKLSSFLNNIRKQLHLLRIGPGICRVPHIWKSMAHGPF